MKASNEKIELFKLAEKERLKIFHSEPFQVVLKLQDWPLAIRITYSKEKSDKILEIEELDAAERIETSCRFKGRSAIGDGCDYLKKLKQAITGIRPKDWKINHQYKTSYYKQH
jgi:hypothetical protein